jgi:hypothetical protein
MADTAVQRYSCTDNNGISRLNSISRLYGISRFDGISMPNDRHSCTAVQAIMAY